MRHFTYSSFAIACIAAIVFVTAGAQASPRCRSGEWYSNDYGRCFSERTGCGQYDGCNRRTCETNSDRLDCRWNERNSSCRAEPRRESCERNEWYSEEHNRCFEERGGCDQYDGYDRTTCETTDDSMSCDWNERSRRCDNVRVRCRSGEWYSEQHNRCFSERGSCSKYNGYSADACRSTEDALKCSWDRRAKRCSGERQRCGRDEWYSERYSRCFQERGQCQQYDGYGRATCENKKDNLSCDWNSRSSLCEAARDDRGGSQCRHGERFNGRRCESRAGGCHRFDGRDKRTCERNSGGLDCDWNDRSRTCNPERSSDRDDRPGYGGGRGRCGAGEIYVAALNTCVGVIY